MVRLLFFFGILFPVFLGAQITGLAAKYYFNEGVARNEAGTGQPKAVGVFFGDDRFGNPHSACYLNGNSQSYLNLGTGPELKPAAGTISVWLMMISENYSGQGYRANPIILVKNAPGSDFFEAYAISYGLDNKRIGGCCSHSELNQISVYSPDPLNINEWHHAVLTYDDEWVKFYLDGELINTAAKNFRTSFLPGDSVMVGNSANVKNSRFFSGCVDDISIYDRVLSAEEVLALYNEPDPNRWHNVFRWCAYILASGGGIYLLVALNTRRLKKELARQKEKNRLKTQMYEMEMKVIKAQMNPHFIFNSMNSIQQFILADDTVNANSYLVKFSRLLRKILESNTDEHITIVNEIDILSKYIEIESLRFGHALSHKITADPRLMSSDTKMPQMLIQPFVENAIWHGLLSRDGNKKLVINFEYINEKLLSCIIDDNGVGRNANKPAETLTKSKSLGIRFIRQRLELMEKTWGGEYGIEIRDKMNAAGESEGTRVIVRIPLIKN